MTTEPVQKNVTTEQTPYKGLNWRGVNWRVWAYWGVKHDLLSAFPYLVGTSELEAFEKVSHEFEQARKAGSTLEDLKPLAYRIYQALCVLMAACTKP